MLHILLDDQSRKCCFNSKNHISSSVHKLIIENYAAGQRGRKKEEKEAEKALKTTAALHLIPLIFLLSTDVQLTLADLLWTL